MGLGGKDGVAWRGCESKEVKKASEFYRVNDAAPPPSNRSFPKFCLPVFPALAPTSTADGPCTPTVHPITDHLNACAAEHTEYGIQATEVLQYFGMNRGVPDHFLRSGHRHCLFAAMSRPCSTAAAAEQH